MIDILGEDKKFIEIVKTGKEEKPYYNIKYLDRVTGKTLIGYSTHNLDLILKFLKEDFIEQKTWRKVEDGLPKKSGEYIVEVFDVEENKIHIDIGEIDCDGVVKKWNYKSTVEVLAWMPLSKGE